MPTNSRLSLACCLLMSVGCSLFISKESSYLRTATNQATQEQVRLNLGETGPMFAGAGARFARSN